MARRSAVKEAKFFVDIKAPKISIRDERGRFTSAQAQLYAQNRELAENLQGQVVGLIGSSMVRRDVSTGRLRKATIDPKNRAFDWDYIGLGNQAFLDKSIAKYWRTIEEGSAKTWTKRSFLDLPLQGFWGRNLSGFAMGPSGPYVTVAPPYDRRPGAMYMPFGRGRGGGRSALPIFTPKKHIAPMHAYKRVAESPNFDRAMLYNARLFWRKINENGIRPNASAWNAGMSPASRMTYSFE